MKRKLLQVRKMLLVAVGLLVGASAWGAEVWDFTNNTIWGSVAFPATDNNFADCSYDANGKAATTGNYVTFHSTAGYLLYGSRNSGDKGIAFARDVADTKGTDDYIKLVVPAGATAGITIYTSSNRTAKVSFNGEESTFNASWGDTTTDFINETGSPQDLIIYCNSNPGGAGDPPYLKKISLKETVEVTVNYLDEQSNQIKAPVVSNEEVGVEFTPDYPEIYYVSDTDPYTYTYKEGATTEVLTGPKTFNIIYKKADRTAYTLNVTQSYGGKSEKLIDAQTIYEGASFTYYCPRYILDGTTLYEFASSNDPNKVATYWESKLSNVKANADYTLTYKAKDGVCVYYAEAEDVDGAVLYTNSTFTTRSSNGGIGVLNNKTLTTLGAGTYTISTRVIGKADGPMSLYKASAEADNLLLECKTNTTGTEATSEAFTLTESTDIIANGGYNTTSENGYGFDYVYIMQTSTPATIGKTGYTTFASTVALDLDNLPDGLTAYYASTVTENSVTLKKATGEVAAEVGLILAGTANETYDIPVATSGDAIEGNLLVGCPNGDTLTENGNQYVLVANADNKAEFQCLEEMGATIPAGKAYLEVPTESIGARLSIVIGGETTGIAEVATAGAENGAIYNLSGQRISKPANGLYIVNGKKVIIK